MDLVPIKRFLYYADSSSMGSDNLVVFMDEMRGKYGYDEDTRGGVEVLQYIDYNKIHAKQGK